MSTAYRPHLAPRELTILDLMNRGLPDAQIAQRLGLTRGGAAAAVGIIRRKFGGGTRYDVVSRARAMGIVRVPKDGGLKPPRRVRPRNVQLSTTERNVLALMNRGLDNAQIAKRLRIGERSAQTYAHRIGSKLGGGSRFEVVQAARRLGLVRTLGRTGPATPGPVRSNAPHLTRRELDVLELMNRGLTNGQIAEALGVTLSSANSYVTNVRTRIGGATRYEVVQRARQLHMVKAPANGGLQEMALTPFQKRVLELAAQHLTNTQIGKRLRRTLDAVTDALKYSRKKLGVKTTVDALDRAVDLGLLTIPKQMDAPNPFSQRELDILEGLFAGLMHREIAAELGITIGNVGGRIQQMKSKVRAHDIDELLDEVERLRLYTPRQPRKRLIAREVLAKRRSASHGVKVLTPRQIDVIEAVARRPNALLPEVASDLGISPNTLQGHLTNIRQRLGVHKSRDVAEEAFKLGIVRMRPRAR
ncbi:MAG: LuxR C-terminal-related transcriptional regulator [Candidatus Tyrphobacter sp.]